MKILQVDLQRVKNMSWNIGKWIYPNGKIKNDNNA